MAARPQVTIINSADGTSAGTTSLPSVFKAPIRTDVVQFVHTNMAKNKRQAYAVYRETGHETPAESWGTGRAVARIPRVPGGGTSRSGQAAFGNMCRGGRMFAPTKVWRRWHRKINVNQRRYAAVSAIAASALPALVMARGHRINNVAEVPCVVDDEVESYKTTKQAVNMLKTIGAFDDVEKCATTKKMRAGKGKLRNRRKVMRRGPLVVYGSKNDGVYEAFRNIPGVDVCPVSSLGLLQLAPGGHVGRFVIFTKSAFTNLDAQYGTYRKKASARKYSLPRPSMANADVVRLINSDEVQSVVQPQKKGSGKAFPNKNPLRNISALLALNPYAKTMKRNAILFQQARLAAKQKK